ncbi:MAG: hypothetical protein E4H14_07750 [Candidatus Thorarchaeota archaeon]|nr:MAG: hypothetical protein E4H14_07750 [Candidatus Thorarchaeota archaeon]
MPIVRRRVALSVIVIAALAFGAFAPIVNAAYVTTVEISDSIDLQPAENGHTYMYVDNQPRIYTNEKLVHSEDISYTDYSYSSTGWDTDTSSYIGPASRTQWFSPGSMVYRGWLHDGTQLPAFYDFANSTNDYDLGIEQTKNLFGVPIGEQCSLIYEPGTIYCGVFNVTDQEFFHLTISSRQDESGFEILVIDELGRIMGYTELAGGDVTVLPFAPDLPGMYTILVYGEVGHGGVCVLEFLLESITPEILTFGTIVEGVLPGSEFVVLGEGGDIVYNEKAPTVHTYKLAANSTSPGLASYSMNAPELATDIYEPFEPYLIYTSNSVYVTDGLTMKIGDMFGYPGDSYYYKNFGNESYYVSFIGMEDVSYTLINTLPDISPLPIGEPFYMENMGAIGERRAYTLSLGSDSILKLNTTDTSDYSWFCYSVGDDGFLHYTGISAATTFHEAPHYYLPAGDYIFMATSDSTDSSCHSQFTLGPIIEGAGGVAVDTGSVVGVRVPTSALTLYQGNVTLVTHDNVSVYQDIDYLNMYGEREALTNPLIGNQQNGIGWIAYGTNFSTTNLGTPTNYDMFPEGFAIVVLSPYKVLNNTAGLGMANEYFDYTVDYSVTFTDWAPNLFNVTLSAAVTNSAVWANQTLGFPDAGTEYYRFDLTCPVGTWLNVSWWSEDLDTLNNIWLYQNVDGYPSRLDYTDIAETQTGSDQEGSFQFGCMGHAIIIFEIDRLQVAEGSLDVRFTPFLTNYFDLDIPLIYVSPSGVTGGGGVAPAIDILPVALGVGAVAVVIVVVLFVLKKKGKF